MKAIRRMQANAKVCEWIHSLTASPSPLGLPTGVRSMERLLAPSFAPPCLEWPSHRRPHYNGIATRQEAGGTRDMDPGRWRMIPLHLEQPSIDLLARMLRVVHRRPCCVFEGEHQTRCKVLSADLVSNGLTTNVGRWRTKLGCAATTRQPYESQQCTNARHDAWTKFSDSFGGARGAHRTLTNFRAVRMGGGESARCSVPISQQAAASACHIQPLPLRKNLRLLSAVSRSSPQTPRCIAGRRSFVYSKR